MAVRWMLVFPTAVIVPGTLGTIGGILVLAGGFPVLLYDVLYPPAVGLFSLYLVFRLAPAHQRRTVLILIALRSLFIPVSSRITGVEHAWCLNRSLMGRVGASIAQ